jgi:hypothetical protein
MGNPLHGISCKLFGIVNQNEEALLELDQHDVHVKLESKINKFQAQGIVMQAKIKKLCTSTGDQLVSRLVDLQGSV